MLRQRVITALVLVALLLPALFAASYWPFALLTLVAIGAAGWEWARLNGTAGAGAVGLGGALALACGAALLAGWVTRAPASVWWLAAAVWVLAGSYALYRGPQAWPQLPALVRQALGLLVLWAGWLALAQARTLGINFILSLFCTVWMADVAAYFGGRTFGRHKLAPSISPGKSWEGVWSGMLGVVLLALVWVWGEQRIAVDSASLFALLQSRLGALAALVALLALAAMSVVGDLLESLVKRAAGAKDSSGLLPGHGGVLDRIDALLPVFPIALAMVLP